MILRYIKKRVLMKNNEKSSKNVGSGIWFEVIWFHRILLRIESQEIGRGKKKTNEMTETRSRKDDWLGGQLRRHKRQPGRPTVEQQVAPSCQAGRQNKKKKSFLDLSLIIFEDFLLQLTYTRLLLIGFDGILPFSHNGGDYKIPYFQTLFSLLV